MKNLFCLFVLFISIQINSQTTFQKAYGGTSTDGSWCARQTSDGGYIITAESISYGIGGDAMYTIKTNSNGVIQWTKTYQTGSGSNAYGNYVLPAFNGGYINTGICNFGVTGDVYLVRSDNSGNHIWSKKFGGAKIEEGFSIQPTKDSGYVIAGYTASFGAGLADIYVIKTDSSGNTQWTKTYGGTGNEGIQGFGNISIHQTPGGGYIINGYTNSFGAGNYDLYAIKTNSVGTPQWSKTFGGPNIEYGYANAFGETQDGRYMIVGTTLSFGSGMLDLYLVKLDANGNLVWSRTYGGSNDDYGYCVQQTFDGGFIMAGATKSFGAGGFDAYLVRIDINGNFMWSRTYGGAADDFAYSVQQTADSGFVLTGYTDSFGSGMSDVYLVKTDKNGNSGCNQSNPATLITTPPTTVTTPPTSVFSGSLAVAQSVAMSSGGNTASLCLSSVGFQDYYKPEGSIYLFPNPNNGHFILRSEIENIELVLFNLMGQEVFRQKINQGENEIKTERLSKGLYHYSILKNKTQVQTGKIVIE